MPSAQRLLWGDGTRRLANQAAATVAPTRRDRIAEYVASCLNGATRDEISIALELPIQSTTGPVKQLLDLGVLYESGETRDTRYGSPAAVLRIRRAAE